MAATTERRTRLDLPRLGCVHAPPRAPNVAGAEDGSTLSDRGMRGAGCAPMRITPIRCGFRAHGRTAPKEERPDARKDRSRLARGARRRTRRGRPCLGAGHRRRHAAGGHRGCPLQLHVQPVARERQRRRIVEHLVGCPAPRSRALVERPDGHRLRDADTGRRVQLLPQGDRRARPVGLLHRGAVHDPGRPRARHRLRPGPAVRGRGGGVRVSARDVGRPRHDVEPRWRQPSCRPRALAGRRRHRHAHAARRSHGSPSPRATGARPRRSSSHSV